VFSPQVEVTGAIHNGENQLEIEVANRWSTHFFNP
jgi:hypothetical protein